MNPRARVLNLLRGQRDETLPCFNALASFTVPALSRRGLRFYEIHQDAEKMALAAATPSELYGWQSATLPTDLCVEAQAFGARIDWRDDMPEAMWPLVEAPPFDSPQAVRLPAGDFTARGRIPVVCAAIAVLRARVRESAAVGAFLPGPFTLAVQVIPFDALLPAVKHSPNAVGHALDLFTDALIPVANAYHRAGADFITIHEMGGSPGVVGPRAFGELILPRLRRLVAAIPAPRILSVCGKTDRAVEQLAQVGADALHLDQENELARTRRILGANAILLGNLDPVRVIAHGTPESIRAAVMRAAAEGTDAITPGCDLYLETPEANMRALVLAAGQARRA